MQAAARWIVLGALFIIPVLPLYVAGDLFFPFIASKGFAFRILVEIAVGAWVVLAALDPRYRPRFSWILAIYALFVAWMFLADLVAPNAHKAFWSNYERMDGWITMIHVFLLFLVMGSVLTVEKLWKSWWRVFLGASVLIAGYGVLQLMGLLAIHQGGVRLDASFGNAAYFAAYLLFVIAIAVWQGIESRGWLRYGLFALVGVQTILLFATATRGAMLAFVASALLIAFLYALRVRAARRIALGALIAGVLVIAGFWAIKDIDVVRNDPSFGRIASISFADAETRLTLWSMAWKGFLDRPITGWGHEGFNFVFAKYYEPSLYAQEPWFDRAHNVYIDWLSAGGLPAFVLFLSLLGVTLYALWRGPGSITERIFLTGALAAYGFQALFVFDNLFSYVLLAAVIAYIYAQTARPWKLFEQVPALRGVVIAPVALIVTVLVLWFVNVPGIVASQALIRGLSTRDPMTAISSFSTALTSNSFATQELREQYLLAAVAIIRNPQLPVELKEQVYISALNEMQKEVARVPGDPRLRLEFAAGLLAGGLSAEAVAQATAAHELSPKKQTTLLQRGSMRWQAGDRTGAREDFEAAYALDPSFDEPAAYAAAGSVITGNMAAADAFLMNRFGTTTLDYDILRFAYADVKAYDKWIQSAELRVRNYPRSSEQRLALAQAYVAAGQTANARAEIQRMMSLFPETISVGTEFLNSLK
ncbi:MAG TPA: O-antigen ligase family protein [Candidatus Paceibacterota bacterium]|nr:O-antigen ligase family protein [Candidatus Paceibacterota bacterium]